MSNPVIVPLVDLPPALLGEIPTLTRDETDIIRANILAAMGIDWRPDESASNAYLRHVAELNGYPVTIPAHPDIEKAARIDRGMAQILRALA